MIPLFQEHLTNLQSQIDRYEQQLQAKKEEAADLQNLDNEVEQALQTMNTVVDRLQDIDPQSLDLLKNATASLFGTAQDDEQLPQNIQPEVSEIEELPLVETVTKSAEQKSISKPEKQEKEIRWRGIPIKIMYQPNYLSVSGQSHIDIYCDQPLPITNTGYRSVFLPTREVPDLQSAVNHVFDLLDTKARETNWQPADQLSLRLSAMTG